MSTIGKSVGDATPARAYNPVVLVDPVTGDPSVAVGSASDAPFDPSAPGDGPTVISVLLAILDAQLAANVLLNDIKTNTSAA